MDLAWNDLYGVMTGLDMVSALMTSNNNSNRNAFQLMMS